MKRKILITTILSISCSMLFAQKEKAPIWQGNKFYKELDYQKSSEEYNKALTIAPENPLANYNMGNTQFRLNKFDEAVKMYDNTIAKSIEKPQLENAYYNKGVSYSKQKKLDESIASYKEALKLDTKDQQARENLQKALLEKKEQDKQNQQNKNQNQQNKDKKQNDQQKDQDDKKKPEPKDNQSKLNKQQVEQLLKALEQKEKDLQKKMQNKKASSQNPDKDW